MTKIMSRSIYPDTSQGAMGCNRCGYVKPSHYLVVTLYRTRSGPRRRRLYLCRKHTEEFAAKYRVTMPKGAPDA